MPSKNVKAIKDFASIFEQGSINDNYYRRLIMVGDFEKHVVYQKKVNKDLLKITTDRFLNVKLHRPNTGERYKIYDGKKNLKNYYLEMQASINLISDNTLLGVGLGNYQNEIGSYYDELPKINTTEPNINNTYLIIASTCGLLGLASLLWILFSSLKINIDNFRNKSSFLFLGLTGTLLALIIEGFFSYILVSAILVPFTFIIYLSFNYKQYVD